jgi:ParB-like chromosome segregation protein Spo0J
MAVEQQELVGDVRVESILAKWRIPFDLEIVDLGKLKVEQDSQVREEANRAPAGMVKEYALQMEAGAVFPPIIVDRQGWRLLDGNTRMKAAQSINLAQFPAYVVKCVDDDVRRGVAAALNQTGGKRLDEGDAMRAAETLEKLSLTDEQIAMYVGRSIASIRAYRAERKFFETAKLAGVEPEVAKTLPKAVRRKLARVTHVEPFQALTELATVGVRGEALEQAVAAAETARSDSEAVKTLEDLRSELAPQAPPPSGRTRSNTGARATATLRKLLEQSVDLDVAALAKANGSADVWRQGAARINAIVRQLDELAAQEQIG